MRPGNPACYECPKAASTLHRWRVREGVAVCDNCGLKLSKEDSADLYWTNNKD